MGKLNFENVEAAVAHIEGLNTELADTKKKLADVVKAKADADKVAEAEINKAKKAQADAEKIAEDAVKKANALEEALPKKLTAKVDNKTYEVRFGVDGQTKEELAKDTAKLRVLIKGGSSAVKLLEG